MTTIAKHRCGKAAPVVREATPEEEAAIADGAELGSSEFALLAAARAAVLDKLVAAELEKATSTIAEVEALRAAAKRR